ncbi:hypothetical protein APX70_200053 [Pseudomonas syringae pv. maculicola]|uniref:Uncharacterized protein n=1 Tax=Pseudomonas syringae pv. maculicola TaxID=59511 RepID=A0A3M2V6T8_PSEYM|nr:hypothetical protein APX70_200053 [Pseudomonas syringae pv. maculicola]
MLARYILGLTGKRRFGIVFIHVGISSKRVFGRSASPVGGVTSTTGLTRGARSISRLA